MVTIQPFKPRPPRQEFTPDELEGAFKKVCPKDWWKDPISAVVSARDVEICLEAIIHYTGTVPDVFATDDPAKMRLESIGYAAGPCGDR
jgi:hypothetical protein